MWSKLRVRGYDATPARARNFDQTGTFFIRDKDTSVLMLRGRSTGVHESELNAADGSMCRRVRRGPPLVHDRRHALPRATLPSTAVAQICTVILLSLLSCSVKMTASPRARHARARNLHHAAARAGRPLGPARARVGRRGQRAGWDRRLVGSSRSVGTLPLKRARTCLLYPP